MLATKGHQVLGVARTTLYQWKQGKVGPLDRHVLERLPRPDGVISSDLSRCRALAERIAADLDLPLWTTPALREQQMGAWEGRSWESLTAEDEPRIQAYWADYLTAAPPGGESFAELAARVRSCAGSFVCRSLRPYASPPRAGATPSSSSPRPGRC